MCGKIQLITKGCYSEHDLEQIKNCCYIKDSIWYIIQKINKTKQNLHSTPFSNHVFYEIIFLIYRYKFKYH